MIPDSNLDWEKEMKSIGNYKYWVNIKEWVKRSCSLFSLNFFYSILFCHNSSMWKFLCQGCWILSHWATRELPWNSFKKWLHKAIMIILYCWFASYIDTPYTGIIAQKKEEEIEKYWHQVAVFYQNSHY